MNQTLQKLIQAQEQDEAGMRDWWLSLGTEGRTMMIMAVKLLCITKNDPVSHSIGKLALQSLVQCYLKWPTEEVG